MRLWDERGHVTITFADILHAVCNAVAIAKAVVVFVQGRIVKNVLWQMKLVGFYSVEFIFPFKFKGKRPNTKAQKEFSS